MGRGTIDRSHSSHPPRPSAQTLVRRRQLRLIQNEYDERMQTSRLANKGHTVFWLLGLLTVLLGSVTILAVVRSNGDVATVEHTHRILTAVSILEASVSEAESSVRGYILNGQDRYMDEFLAKRPEAEQNAIQLRELVTPADP